MFSIPWCCWHFSASKAATSLILRNLPLNIPPFILQNSTTAVAPLWLCYFFVFSHLNIWNSSLMGLWKARSSSTYSYLFLCDNKHIFRIKLNSLHTLSTFSHPVIPASLKDLLTYSVPLICFLLTPPTILLMTCLQNSNYKRPAFKLYLKRSLQIQFMWLFPFAFFFSLRMKDCVFVLSSEESTHTFYMKD